MTDLELIDALRAEADAFAREFTATWQGSGDYYAARHDTIRTLRAAADRLERCWCGGYTAGVDKHPIDFDAPVDSEEHTQ